MTLQKHAGIYLCILMWKPHLQRLFRAVSNLQFILVVWTLTLNQHIQQRDKMCSWIQSKCKKNLLDI